MSMEISVTTQRTRLPSVKAWQDALDGQRFPFRLDTFDWQDVSGFLPVAYGKIETGFELYLDEIAEVEEQFGESIPEDHDCSVSFRFGGDPNELKAAMCAATTLAQVSNGLFLDPDSGDCLAPAEAIESAKEILETKF